MPVHNIPLEAGDVVAELRRRGYGIDSCHGFAFRIAVRSKTDVRKSTGLGNFVPVGGPTQAQLRQILFKCQTVSEAATAVEKLAKGETVDFAAAAGAAPQISTEHVLYAVDNRIDAKLAPIRQALDNIAALLGGAKATLDEEEDIPPPPPKVRRKRSKQAEATIEPPAAE